MRLINAVREINAGRPAGEPRIVTIALHTEGERTARFVREADEAFDLGPASARPYLDLELLERALAETRADAAWVGWGFVAEDPAFAELCDRIGVTFVGPSAEAMRQLGDKIGAKLLAEEVGVPVAPWSRGPVDDLASATEHAARIGYPLMLKATAGGGGRGIRVVTTDGELADAYERTREEAQRAFGSGVVFLERLVTGARHVEVQVISDGETAWALGVRDCSVQRRNQKVIEESASPVLQPVRRRAAEGVGRAAGRPGRVPRCRHGRVPLPPGRRDPGVPRGQHPAAGRAPDHRAHHRLRPGEGAAARGRRREAGGLPAARARPRRRGPVERRGPGPRLRPRTRTRRAAAAAGRPRHPGRHRAGGGRHHPRRLRLDDRQGDRLRPRPRRGARPVAAGAGRHPRRHRGRRHQQELPARPARPARGGRRLRRHRLDRPRPHHRPPGRARARRDRPRGGRHRGVRAGGAGRAPALLRHRPRRPAAGPAPARTTGRPRAARPGAARHRRPGLARAVPGVAAAGRLRRGRRRGRAPRRLRPARHLRRDHPPGRHRHARHRPLGRGRRRHPPRHARRGWRGPFSRTGSRRRRSGGGR